ncbi:MAG: FkbM family methyltransferase [Ignavibacteria bacterium]|nr:FkbM family methyltransferase [Ignavibacteria bacterium]
MKIKKYLFSLITKSKGTVLGDFLKSASKSIIDALENKDNNHFTNGEFWLISVLKDTDVKTVFDVGANVGVWTNQFKLMHPGTKVYSFEPVPETFEKLKENTQNLNNVQLFNLALSDSSDPLEFNYYPNNSYFSSIYDHPLTGQKPDKKIVKAQKGDDFCTELGIEDIDFLKIDTEGSEPKVLKGFQEMIESGKIKMIQFEYGEINIQNRFLLKDFFDLFENNGYLLGKIYPDFIDFSPYQKEKENFIISNFFAVKTSEEKLLKNLSRKIKKKGSIFN